MAQPAHKEHRVNAAPKARPAQKDCPVCQDSKAIPAQKAPKVTPALWDFPV